ncbi:MAG: hypothetical protein RR060_06995 [Victivallaceae bacterium]
MTLKNFYLLLGMVIVLGVSGCFFRNSEPINYYDLAAPEPLTVKRPILITGVNNYTPVGSEFLYDGENGRVYRDDNNRFVQPFGIMLRRYLQNSFVGTPASGSAMPIQVDIALNQLRVNAAERQIVMSVQANYSGVGVKGFSENYTFRENLSALTPEAVLTALNQVSRQLAEKIYTATNIQN